jgi:hypothetical protein
MAAPRRLRRPIRPGARRARRAASVKHICFYNLELMAVEL